MRFFRLLAITVLLLACVLLGTACAGAKGETGAQGSKGDKGADGVGVENIVNNGDGTFTVNLTNGESYTTDNFTGRRGEQGEQGTQGIQGLPGTPGIGVEWVGEWESGTLYGKYDAVGYQGSSYISKQPNNTNHVPTDTNWWDLWVEKGDTGNQGVQGNLGPNMIVAAGYINGDGTTRFGYNVYGSVLGAGDMYIIDFTNFTYSYLDYVTIVFAGEYHVSYGGAGPLMLWLLDNAGNTVTAPFQFIIVDVTP